MIKLMTLMYDTDASPFSEDFAQKFVHDYQTYIKQFIAHHKMFFVHIHL